MRYPAVLPRLRRLPGNVPGRLNHRTLDKLVAVLMDNGRWDVGTLLEQWDLPDGSRCVMLRFPIREQSTTSTQPFYFDAAALRDLPEGFDPAAREDPYPPS